MTLPKFRMTFPKSAVKGQNNCELPRNVGPWGTRGYGELEWVLGGAIV
jgi:hypothetical protein